MKTGTENRAPIAKVVNNVASGSIVLHKKKSTKVNSVKNFVLENVYGLF